MSIVVQANDLERAIKRVSHALGDGYRRVLTNLRIEPEGDGIVLVAADNFRLATAKVKVEDGTLAEPFMVYEVKALRSFLRALSHSSVVIEAGEQLVTVKGPAASLELPAGVGKYPDWRGTVPAVTAIPDTYRIAVVNPDLLRDALRSGRFGDVDGTNRNAVIVAIGPTPEDPVIVETDRGAYREAIMGVKSKELAGRYPEVVPA